MQEMLDQIRQTFVVHTPNVLFALVILVIGWLIALIAAAAVRKLLERTTVDNKLTGWVAGEDKARRIQIEHVVSRSVFYLIMIFVLVAFFHVLQLTVITEPLNQLLNRLFEFAPQLLGAALLVAIAWVIASVLRLLITRVLTAAKADEKLGSKIATEGKPVAVTRPIGEAMYWLVFLLFLPALLDALSLQGPLDPVKEMFNRILGFLPNLLGAALILIVGWFIARIVQQIVANLLAGVGCDKLSERVGLAQALGERKLSGVLGAVVYFLVLVVVLIAALDTLQLEAITQPASNMLGQILDAVPDLFGAAILLVLAYVVGRVVAGLTANVLAGVGFNGVLVHLGLTKEPTKGKHTPAEIVGQLVLIAILVFASIEAARMLQFEAVAALITKFTVFTGHVILGIIIFGLGLFLANLAANTLRSSNAGNAVLLAAAARVAIIVLAAAMALRQTELANDIINLAFGLLLGAVAVAVALAFGLGGRDIAARHLEKWSQQVQK